MQNSSKGSNEAEQAIKQVYLKKGAIVFVHTQQYPPWPAQIERRLSNGLYKVNFYGEKSYTTIEPAKMDIFTEQRGKQVIQELNNKLHNKSIHIAIRQLDLKRKKGLLDHEMLTAIDNAREPLDLSQYKHYKLQLVPIQQVPVTLIKDADPTANKSQAPSTNIGGKRLCSATSQLPMQHTDTVLQLTRILDGVYDFIILPVNQKLPPGISEQKFLQNKQYFDSQLVKFKQMASFKDPKTELTLEKALYENKFLEKLIMIVKAYESFRYQSEKYFEEFIYVVRDTIDQLNDSFKDSLEKKRMLSHKDRILLKKFENLEAYGW